MKNKKKKMKNTKSSLKRKATTHNEELVQQLVSQLEKNRVERQKLEKRQKKHKEKMSLLRQIFKIEQPETSNDDSESDEE